VRLLLIALLAFGMSTTAYPKKDKKDDPKAETTNTDKPKELSAEDEKDIKDLSIDLLDVNSQMQQIKDYYNTLQTQQQQLGAKLQAKRTDDKKKYNAPAGWELDDHGKWVAPVKK